jgi:two-component system response regulator FixJ
MAETAVPFSQCATSRRVYALDDNEEMCRSLDALLSSEGYDLQYFTCPKAFLSAKDDLQPGVLLLDLRMPEIDGMDILAKLGPELDKFRTIVFTAHGEIETAVKAIKLGARDFLQKPFHEDKLFEILERESQEQPTPEQTEPPSSLLDQMSPRERDVVVMLSKGMPNKVIAAELDISVRTVEMHRARAMQRLGCRSFADLLRLVFSASPD